MTDYDKRSDTGMGSEEIVEEGKYKLFGIWEISCLQRINNAKGYTLFHCLFAIIASALSSGIVIINVSTIEQRFGLSSSDSALVVIGYDISFCVLTVFITYFGGVYNRARLLSIGCATYGLGALIYSLPHFVTGQYISGGSTLEVTCNVTFVPDCASPPVDVHDNMYIMFSGQLLLGAGVTPLYTLSLAYIEDSVSTRSSAIYLGLANGAAGFGPLIGFVAGGLILSYFFVDFDTSSSTSYIESYYLSHRFASGTIESRRSRETEMHENNATHRVDLNASTSVTNLPRAILSLLRNPTYMCLTMSGCFQALLLTGSSTFMAKYFENAFNATAGEASLLTGVALVPAVVIGNVLGGILVYGFKWQLPSILKFCVAVLTGVIAFSPCFLLYCDNVNVVGVFSEYGTPGESISIEKSNLTAKCNAHCDCQEEYFIPVCGNDNVTYFSPCQAGCLAESSDIEGLYYGCTCVASNLPNGNFNDFYATYGMCEEKCKNQAAFLAIAFFMVLCAFLTFTPMLVATFSVGLQFLFYRALGTIPGPNLYGALIDSACELWQTEQCSGKRGSCWIYSNKQMSETFMIVGMVGNALAVSLFVLALYLYKPAARKEITLSKLESTEHSTSESDQNYDDKKQLSKDGKPDFYDNWAIEGSSQQLCTRL